VKKSLLDMPDEKPAPIGEELWECSQCGGVMFRSHECLCGQRTVPRLDRLKFDHCTACHRILAEKGMIEK